MFPCKYIHYQDKMYWIYRELKEGSIKEGGIQPIKEFWDCDIVLKHKINDSDTLFFLREIPEAEIITEALPTAL